MSIYDREYENLEFQWREGDISDEQFERYTKELFWEQQEYASRQAEKTYEDIMGY